jgi:hypothetical protein
VRLIIGESLEMTNRPGLGKRPSSTNKGVSPPPTKKQKQQSTTTSECTRSTAARVHAESLFRQSHSKFLHPGIKERARENDMADREQQFAHRSLRRISCRPVRNTYQIQTKNSSIRLRTTISLPLSQPNIALIMFPLTPHIVGLDIGHVCVWENIRA